MKSIYLAGPITGTSYNECTGWREYVTDKVTMKGNIWCYSPMRAKEYLAGEEVLDGSYEQSLLSSQRGLFTRDMNDCKTCDMVIVNLLGAKTVSIGTVMEISAFWWQRKPIVLIMEDGNVHNHPMIREACPFIVHTLDEAIHVMMTILFPVGH